MGVELTSRVAGAEGLMTIILYYEDETENQKGDTIDN